MKKLLALVLALVMSMSLVTISNAADFADAKDIDNKEAVEVMNAIGVLIGDENGKFNPDANLTRAQAAKIICVMLLGKDAADGLNLKSTFSDASGWAESYIAYCASQGIVAGVGNGKFDPDGQLTGYQFAKMLLVALGYKADLEGMTGADWQVATAKLALNAGLTDGMSIALSKTLTRDEAAKMAFNTLTATMVEYSNGVNVSTSDGTQVTVNAVRTKVGHITTTGYKAGSNANDEYTQFCEQYFDKLKLTSTTSTDDAFDRPASEWSFKGVKVGTYAKEAAFTYTASASGSTTSAKLSNMGIKGYKLAAGVKAVTNGVPASDALTSIDDIPRLLGNGTKVELFVDEDDIETITDVIVIKTQLMQIDRINKSAKTVALKKVDNAGETIAKVGEDDTGYAALSAMKADDYVLVTYVRNSDNTAYVVSSIDVPAAVTGKLTRVSTSNNSVNGVTVAGTAYSLAATKGSAFDGLNNSSIAADKDCTVYVDSYGYAVYIKDVTASTTYIVYADTYSSLVDGKIVHIVSGYDMDGVKITLNVGTLDPYHTLSKGAVYSYTTTTDNSADYVINTAVASKTAEIKKSDARYDDGNFYADDVKFLFVSTTKDNSDTITSVDSVSVKSGKQAVASGVTTYAILNSDNEVTTVVVIGEADVAEGSSVAYVKKFVGFAGKVDSKETYLYDLYIDGELVKGVQSKQRVSANTFVTYEQDGDLYTLKAYTASDKTTSVARWQGVTKDNIASDKYIVAGGVYYTMASDAQVIDLTDDNAYGSLGDMKDTNKTFVLDVVYNGNSTSSNYRTINYIFVVSATDPA